MPGSPRVLLLAAQVGARTAVLPAKLRSISMSISFFPVRLNNLCYRVCFEEGTYSLSHCLRFVGSLGM